MNRGIQLLDDSDVTQEICTTMRRGEEVDGETGMRRGGRGRGGGVAQNVAAPQRGK